MSQLFGIRQKLKHGEGYRIPPPANACVSRSRAPRGPYVGAMMHRKTVVHFFPMRLLPTKADWLACAIAWPPIIFSLETRAQGCDGLGPNNVHFEAQPWSLEDVVYPGPILFSIRPESHQLICVDWVSRSRLLCLIG